ncbi:hypothetical protein [Polynucleobacter sp. AM-7D1]|uniref:hypothetical protein n=1 Tax=Polynucleobacter sp. AM-7D1 TaxID=2689102 RepID=UPI001BFDEC03|nr:hypothetical protein [Polynucleobacter sp. AM-7D1]QWE28099.1 hypothetical protein GQ359_06665 [Polynucleobacter sp. AM-7D1]
MKNQLQAHGKMFGLAFKSITKEEFNELIKTGRAGGFYKSLKESNNREIVHYGFFQWEGKPSFEIKVNEARMGLKKTLLTDYERTYLPILGSSKKTTGMEKFIYVSESGFKNGNSELEFDGDFDPKELKFEYKRYGLYNGTIFTVINPTYKGGYFNYIWNWSSFSSDYIISTRGKLFELN